MSKDAYIQISRVSISDEEDQIQVEVILDKGDIHLRLKMSMENFAKTLMGDAKVECQISRRKGF